eukprot:scaffold34451_cov101-Isochrysis_galbana.AAC.1
MLSCRRTDAYLAALEAAAPSLIHGKAVLDVGCGSGVLSLACARLGARVVYAVEASGMAVLADRIVSDNGMAGVVKVIRGRMEEVCIPTTPVPRARACARACMGGAHGPVGRQSSWPSGLAVSTAPSVQSNGTSANGRPPYAENKTSGVGSTRQFGGGGSLNKA